MTDDVAKTVGRDVNNLLDLGKGYRVSGQPVDPVHFAHILGDLAGIRAAMAMLGDTIIVMQAKVERLEAAAGDVISNTEGEWNG